MRYWEVGRQNSIFSFEFRANDPEQAIRQYVNLMVKQRGFFQPGVLGVTEVDDAGVEVAPMQCYEVEPEDVLEIPVKITRIEEARYDNRPKQKITEGPTKAQGPANQKH